MKYMIMLEINPLSKIVSISEMFILLAIATLIGWLIGRWIINGKISSLRATLVEQEGELNDCNNRRNNLMITQKQTVKSQDDLKIIEGIGPKIEALLNVHGIFTFDQLYNSKPTRLIEMLQNAGPRFQMHDPTTWGEQARLARDQRWEELQALQDKLDGGRIV